MHRLGWSAALSLTLALAIAPAVHAQDDDAGMDAEARALFQAGDVAFREGRFESALGYFQRAYELSRRPGLLYNLGATADRLRRDADAARWFRQYLAEQPDPPNRGEVEARLAVLDRAIAEHDAATPPPADTTTTTDTTEASAASDANAIPVVSPAEPAPASDGGPGPGPWIIVGVGAALVVVGAILIGIAVADVSAVEGAPRGTTWASVADAYDRSEPLSVAGSVLIGAGAIGVLGGVLWGVSGGGRGDDDVSLRIGPGSISMTGSF